MFKGKEFCVVNGIPDMSKEMMERKIVEVSSCHDHTHSVLAPPTLY